MHQSTKSTYLEVSPAEVLMLMHIEPKVEDILVSLALEEDLSDES